MISVAQQFHIGIQFVVLQKHVTIQKTNSSRLLVKIHQKPFDENSSH